MIGTNVDSKHQPRKVTKLTLAAVGFVVLSLCIFAALSLHYVIRARFDARVTVCGSGLYTLGNKLKIYAYDHGGVYPAPERWCDLLTENTQVNEHEFICIAARAKGDTSRCHYAINPNCEPNSPNDVVLLFETTGGWNQFGGPEILTTENHKGKGCNVLFNDGSVEFVKPERLGELKWEAEEGEE